MAASGSCSVAMTGRRRSGMGIGRGMEPFLVASMGPGESRNASSCPRLTHSDSSPAHFVEALKLCVILFLFSRRNKGQDGRALGYDGRALPLGNKTEQTDAR